MQQESIKILIADDHPLMRQALISLIKEQPDFIVVGEAGDGAEAIKQVKELKPDIVIMDISMPGMSGLEATRQIKKDFPTVAVLVLTVHNDRTHIIGLLEAGAAGYLVKSIFGNEVVNAIRAVVSGDSILSRSILNLLLKHASEEKNATVSVDARTRLSSRELQILKLAASGMSNKEIAEKLSISTRTVKGYFVNIFSKLDVGSRTEAVLSGLRANLFSLDNLEQ